ncbi:unnamed protein product [Camellia sinensis]
MHLSENEGIEGKTFVVAGGLGFVGSSLCLELLRRGAHQVRTFDLRTTSPCSHHLLNKGVHCIPVWGGVEVGLIKEDTTRYEGASLRTEDNHGVMTNRKESMIPRKMRIKTVQSDANITFLISNFENDRDLVELDWKSHGIPTKLEKGNNHGFLALTTTSRIPSGLKLGEHSLGSTGPGKSKVTWKGPLGHSCSTFISNGFGISFNIATFPTSPSTYGEFPKANINSNYMSYSFVWLITTFYLLER